MDLTTIENPGFLKEMSVEEMEDLAADIRAFLIHSLSRTGGHIASNLGVVELTIAMHYVFDMPHDKIFFDVGHQCYTHKILTGRAKEFDTYGEIDHARGALRRAWLMPLFFHGMYDACALTGTNLSMLLFALVVIANYVILLRIVKKESRKDEPLT